MKSTIGITFNGTLLSKHIRSNRVIDAKNHVLMSSSQAAKIIGCSKATMSRAESGQVVDAITLYSLCKWLNKPMETYFSKVKSQSKG